MGSTCADIMIVERGILMKSRMQQRGLTVLLVVVSLIQIFPILTFAEPSVQTYYYDTFIRTKEDKGYSGEEPVNESDKHYGWKLGKFVIEGYTNSPSQDENGTQVFLKNVGDTVTLSFFLDQDVNKLNGDEKLTIGEDKDGYDLHFQLKKQDFGRGALIVKHTDYQNSSAEPIVYRDYLSSLTVGANTQIKLCEEGDYEVALNYKVREAHVSIAGHNTLPTETDYRIFYTFSVRNGNCMVYPFDILTGAELSNSSMTENGFKLDLAKSRYLDINIKKEMLTDSADGLIEDTRFNKSAQDGDEYTDEGIYTITVKNRYTIEQTIKKIYVGKNNVLKEYFIAGLSSTNSDQPNANLNTGLNNETDDGNAKISNTKIVIIAILTLCVIFVIILILLKKRNTSDKAHNNSQNRADVEGENK